MYGLAGRIVLETTARRKCPSTRERICRWGMLKHAQALEEWSVMGACVRTVRVRRCMPEEKRVVNWCTENSVNFELIVERNVRLLSRARHPLCSQTEI